MNPKHFQLILLTMMGLVTFSYLLFLAYALSQMKEARTEGMAKIDSILDTFPKERVSKPTPEAEASGE